MITKFVIPIIAAALTLFAIVFVAKSEIEPPPASPPVSPPGTPYPNTVAGAGIIEAQTEDIDIGSPLPGIVTEVLVQEGDHVKQGDPLFRLDDRSLRAELRVRQAAVTTAKAQLEKLEHEPRPEDVPVSEALVRQAEAVMHQNEDHLARIRKLIQSDAASAEDLETGQRDFLVAKAELDRVRSQLALLKAGTWKYDLDIAQAAVTSAAADVAQTETELERLVVRASVDGEVLQVNVRPGVYITTFGQQSAIVLGNTQDLHLRVDIDEYDIPRFEQHAPAIARRRGHADDRFPLKFVRVDPFVIPKQSLTGESTERVDTRVLQVIYEIDPLGEQLYVGQQLDVFIDVEQPDAGGTHNVNTKKDKDTIDADHVRTINR